MDISQSHKWYLFHANTFADEPLSELCPYLGVEILNPTITDYRKSKRTRRKQAVGTTRAFPGYTLLGCLIDVEFPFEMVVQSHVSVHAVPMTTVDEATGEPKLSPGRIRGSDIAKVLQNHIFDKEDTAELLENIYADPEFKLGDEVRIFGGLFAGYEGEVKRVNARDQELLIGLGDDFTVSGVSVPFDRALRLDKE